MHARDRGQAVHFSVDVGHAPLRAMKSRAPVRAPVRGEVKIVETVPEPVGDLPSRICGNVPPHANAGAANATCAVLWLEAGDRGPRRELRAPPREIRGGVTPVEPTAPSSSTHSRQLRA